MKHKLLIETLKKYGNISDEEEKKIIEIFNPKNSIKKEVLIYKHSLCNKLFFVNRGLLRAYYTDINGNEITRRIAWEKGFLTNMDSFRKNGLENNETIECIENAEILEISKNNLDFLLQNSYNLMRIYQIILEKYMAFNIRSYQQITTLSPEEKLIYFRENFPTLKNRINDTILSSFLSLSRKTIVRTRKKLLKN